MIKKSSFSAYIHSSWQEGKMYAGLSLKNNEHWGDILGTGVGYICNFYNWEKSVFEGECWLFPALFKLALTWITEQN